MHYRAVNYIKQSLLALQRNLVTLNHCGTSFKTKNKEEVNDMNTIINKPYSKKIISMYLQTTVSSRATSQQEEV